MTTEERLKRIKIIATIMFSLFIAGCTSHVSSGVSYEYSSNSGRLAVAHTPFGPVYR